MARAGGRSAVQCRGKMAGDAFALGGVLICRHFPDAVFSKLPGHRQHRVVIFENILEIEHHHVASFDNRSILLEIDGPVRRLIECPTFYLQLSKITHRVNRNVLISALDEAADLVLAVEKHIDI